MPYDGDCDMDGLTEQGRMKIMWNECVNVTNVDKYKAIYGPGQQRQRIRETIEDLAMESQPTAKTNIVGLLDDTWQLYKTRYQSAQSAMSVCVRLLHGMESY